MKKGKLPPPQVSYSTSVKTHSRNTQYPHRCRWVDRTVAGGYPRRHHRQMPMAVDCGAKPPAHCARTRLGRVTCDLSISLEGAPHLGCTKKQILQKSGSCPRENARKHNIYRSKFTPENQTSGISPNRQRGAYKSTLKSSTRVQDLA